MDAATVQRFPNCIRHLRQTKNVRITDIARATGTSISQICKYERGLQEPPVWRLQRIATLLDTTMEALLCPAAGTVNGHQRGGAHAHQL